MKSLRLLGFVLVGVFALGLALKRLRPGPVPLRTAAALQAESPHFALSLPRPEAPRTNRATVAAALQDATASGEECDFGFATTCPDTGRLMYVLNVRAVSDTQLVHAGSSDGTRLISKACWSGFGRWAAGP